MIARAFIATSLDGYIADADGGLAWLVEADPVEGEDFGFGAFIADCDALVMGRATYETVLGFGGDWPYDIPVYVRSRTWHELPAGGGPSELIAGSPTEIMTTLGRRGHRSLYIDGGQVITDFIVHDALDEIIITRLPVLLGSGHVLFGDTATVRHLDHLSTSSWPNGMVQSHYRFRPAGRPAGAGTT